MFLDLGKIHNLWVELWLELFTRVSCPGSQGDDGLLGRLERGQTAHFPATIHLTNRLLEPLLPTAFV